MQNAKTPGRGGFAHRRLCTLFETSYPRGVEVSYNVQSRGLHSRRSAGPSKRGANRERTERTQLASSQSRSRAMVYELDTLQPKAEELFATIPLIHQQLGRLGTGDQL